MSLEAFEVEEDRSCAYNSVKKGCFSRLALDAQGSLLVGLLRESEGTDACTPRRSADPQGSETRPLSHFRNIHA